MARTSEAGPDRRTTALVIAFLRVSVLGSKFLATIFLAKFAGLDVVGQYGLIVGAAAVLPVALGFGFAQSLSRQLVTASCACIASSLLRYWSGTVVIYVACGALWLCLGDDYRLGMDRLSVGLVVAVLLFEHINNDIFLLVSSLKRPLAANLLNFGRTTLWMAVYLPAAALDQELRTFTWLLGFWAAGGTCSFIVGVVLLSKADRSPLTDSARAPASQNVLSAWTLYAGEVCNGLGLYLDRYLIGAMFGTKVAGLYVLLSSFGQSIYTLANTSIMQVYRPYLIEAYVRGRLDEFARLHDRCTRKTLWSSVVLGVACVSAVHLLAPLVDAWSLIDHESLLWVLVLASLARLWSDLQGYVMFTQRRDAAFASTTCVCLGLSATFNLGLIPLWGVYGSAVAALFSFIATGLVRRAMISRGTRSNSTSVVVGSGMESGV